MATDRTATWSLGESALWYSPTSEIDAGWSLGASFIQDEVGDTPPQEATNTGAALMMGM